MRSSSIAVRDTAFVDVAKISISSEDDSYMKSVSKTSSKTPSWTFFTNHAHVLILLALEEDMVLREIANRVQITERAVQKIIVELEDAGFIERRRIGRKNSYKLHLNRPLRHPIEQHRTVADVVSMLKPK